MRRVFIWITIKCGFILNYILEKISVVVVFRFGSAIGEHVTMTAAVEHIAEKTDNKIIVLSNHQWIFENNPKVTHCSDLSFWPLLARKYLVTFLSKCKQSRILEFRMRLPGSRSFEEHMRSNAGLNKKHLVQLHTIGWPKIYKPLNNIPKIYLLGDKGILQELSIPNKFALIQSGGKLSFTPNKEWGEKKFQEVVDKTRDVVSWVQVGLPTDKKLNHCIDIRGKVSFTKLAKVVESANFGLFQEGFFCHLAASLNTRTYTIYTGFLDSSISSYPKNIPIKSDPVECSPCWLLDPCPQKMQCLRSTNPDVVVTKILKDIKGA